MASCFHVEAMTIDILGKIKKEKKKERKFLAINQGVSNLKLSPSVKPSFHKCYCFKAMTESSFGYKTYKFLSNEIKIITPNCTI